MENIIKRYSWDKVRLIESEDEMLFLRMFYLSDIPIKIKDNMVYCPYQYIESANTIITAHYENKLSLEYYSKFGKTFGFTNTNTNNSKSERHLLKMIGPVILVVLLLVFIKFLLLYNIL